MKIGIIGAGGIGRLYAKRWTDAGHEVVVSSRNPDKLSDFTAETGIRATTAAEAAAFDEAILLAVNYGTLDEALRRIAPHVSGKLLIDATNPLEFVDGAVTRTTPEEELAGVAMAARLPQARVGKAFTSLWTGHVETSGTGLSESGEETSLGATDQTARAYPWGRLTRGLAASAPGPAGWRRGRSADRWIAPRDRNPGRRPAPRRRF